VRVAKRRRRIGSPLCLCASVANDRRDLRGFVVNGASN
jgi:hypothetical protein